MKGMQEVISGRSVRRQGKATVESAASSAAGELGALEPVAMPSPMAAMAPWPAAGIDRNGCVHASHPEVLEALGPVLSLQHGPGAQLTASATRLLWAMVDSGGASTQWKVLDPVHWPFIGIVGWSSQNPDALQLAAWRPAPTAWEVDDSWRQLLAATAAVRARRRGSAA